MRSYSTWLDPTQSLWTYSSLSVYLILSLSKACEFSRLAANMANHDTAAFLPLEMPAVSPGPLASLAKRAAAGLAAAGHDVVVFETSTGGLIQACRIGIGCLDRMELMHCNCDEFTLHKTSLPHRRPSRLARQRRPTRLAAPSHAARNTST